MKRFISSIIILAMILSCTNLCFAYGLPSVNHVASTDTAYAVEGGNIYYSSDGVITCADKEITSADIPDEINGVKITSIGEYAFNECKELTTVIIPDCVTDIGSLAFWDCYALININIPDNVTEINPDTFLYCINLTDIVIPKNIEFIHFEAFGGCKRLTNILIPSSVKYIDETAFNYCDKEKLYMHVEEDSYADMWAEHFGFKVSYDTFFTPAKSYPVENGNIYYKDDGVIINADSSITRADIPDIIDGVKITSIAGNSFCECSDLTSVTLPNDITTIGSEAFYGCNNLTDINLPDNITSIGDFAFCLCEELTDITIPKNIFHIKNGVFYFCTSLKNVIIPDGVIMIGNYSFNSCKNLTSITIPDTVSNIESNAFDYCDKSLLVMNVVKDSDADTWAKENGWQVSYTTAVSADKNSANNVSITINSTNVTVGDNTYDMDSTPYIQTSSNSAMVPLRFVTIAVLGDDVQNADNSNIISWDSDTKTATITVNDKSINFTADSNIININGTPTAMDNNVTAEIKDGRMYIPFRALGNALDVEVEWISNTKTAVYKT